MAKFRNGNLIISSGQSLIIDGDEIIGVSDDASMADDSSTLIPTQKATKAYADTHGGVSQAYVDAGDATTLLEAKAYADTHGGVSQAYVDAGDATTLLEAKAYTDTHGVSQAYVDAGDATTLLEAKVYVDANTGVQSIIEDGNSYVSVIDDSTAAASIEIEADQTLVMTVTDTGITLISGATVGEFSTDGTLTDDSDTAVPTEKAVKTYVDTLVDSVKYKVATSAPASPEDGDIWLT
jgi:hypothetical protein